MKVKESNIELENSLNNLGKNEPVIVFISYATKDSERFQIPIIAEKLMKCPGIKKVLYWEEHMRDDIIKYMNDIPVLYTSCFRIIGVDPAGFISIPVPAQYLARKGFTCPGYIVTLGMDPPPAVVGHQKKWVLFGPLAGYPFIMGFTLFYPFGNRTAFHVIREILCNTL